MGFQALKWASLGIDHAALVTTRHTPIRSSVHPGDLADGCLPGTADCHHPLTVWKMFLGLFCMEPEHFLTIAAQKERQHLQ
jgi:hypothetical protein